MGRLLQRACCQAPVGLEVDIDLFGSPPGNADYISKLLQPGISCGGWHKVHKLQVSFDCWGNLALDQHAKQLQPLL
jgi:hypothetical protein